MATWRQAGPSASAAQDSMHPHGRPAHLQAVHGHLLALRGSDQAVDQHVMVALEALHLRGGTRRGARQRGVERRSRGASAGGSFPARISRANGAPRAAGAGRGGGGARQGRPARPPKRAPEPCPRAARTGGVRARRRPPQAWLGSTARGAPSSGRSGRAEQGRRGRRQRSFWGLERLGGVLRGLLWARECVGGPAGRAWAGCESGGVRGWAEEGVWR